MASERTLPVPRDFLCPITREIMTDPVVLVDDGRSYELYAIERWLRDHNSSPMTNQPLTDRRYIPNFNLRNAIEEYCSQRETIVSANRFLNFNVRCGRIPVEWQDHLTLKIRVSLLGGSNVGKTTIAHYLQYGDQMNLVYSKSMATIGPDLVFFYLDQLYEDKYVITVQLTDIPGMERYESCCDNHFRTCHGALLVADSTEMDTLERVELYWYEQLHIKGKEDVESTLVCNKVDLFEQNCDDSYKRIFLARAEHFSSSHNMSMCHASALRGDNVQVMFKQLILRILQNKPLLNQLKATDVMHHTSAMRKNSTRRDGSIELFDRSTPRAESGNCCK